jgi:CHASE2 domain-containing sensor protein
LFYLTAVAVTLPLLRWNGLVQQMNASSGDILFWTRGPVHSPSVARIVLLAIDDSTLRDYGPLPIRRSVLADAIRCISAFHLRALIRDMLLAEPGRPEDDRMTGTQDCAIHDS